MHQLTEKVSGRRRRETARMSANSSDWSTSGVSSWSHCSDVMVMMSQRASSIHPEVHQFMICLCGAPSRCLTGLHGDESQKQTQRQSAAVAG